MNNDNHELILDGRRMGAAVYAVEHVASGRRLVCGTRCLAKRLSDQRRYLAHGEHHNPSLLADLVNDGPEAFRLVLLELVADRRQLRQRRHHHVVEARGKALCYNVPEPDSRRQLVVAPEVATGLASKAPAPSRSIPELLSQLRQQTQAPVQVDPHQYVDSLDRLISQAPAAVRDINREQLLEALRKLRER